MMTGLENVLAAREDQMTAARELHQFNHDVFEAVSLVRDKLAQMPGAGSGDPGDLRGVQALLRRHEAFETDLVALETQLLGLVEEADRLAQEYPGEAEETLSAGKQRLIGHWQELKSATAANRKTLQLSLELQKYRAMARDQLEWLGEQQAVVADTSSAPLSSLPAIQAAQTSLDAVRTGLEIREPEFSLLVERGDRMVTGENAHPNVQEVRHEENFIILQNIPF